MKKLLMTTIALTMFTAAYSAKYQDGTYRGYFTDEVAVEFELKDDVVTAAKYRTLGYKGTDYLKDTQDVIKGMKSQYEALLTFAVGKNVDEAMKAMYTPDKIEKAGATIRSTKVRAAMKNGIIHDPYALPKK